ncbi:Fe(3+) ABC transporter substrate-binding protein [Pectobacterium versatile]|uniref:Fe(3+) ABC transporter substrate-binding protein n=1 Tax=Pectobacterium versatile TaxID=2488639 RepID=UPI000DE648D9|nr:MULTISPECIES: Fe(3+) ABC transporter substrate-binding protein [Pectobacterium]MBD0848460.1 iron ABC transporter substrate-binding protein [Pectobacterium carotovorum subsp. carotovorum]MBK4825399.1 Iron uptake protein [Pectobacterium carotovorum subsp. carotovorum]MCA5932573.1 Fe(3+) ABC transporter substrate-binding protein [Pectobacterium versatile]MCA5949833.1 Fe(3+) ABC transporter substrate-binding protein [Pectobacterium versatile]MCA5954176.1 Fe(3+) ABC transporter substrate-binding
MSKTLSVLRKKARLLTLASSIMVAYALPAAAADDSLTLYTTREPGLIQPLLDAFTKEMSVKVNTVFIKDGMLERVKAEGQNSPADLLMTVDAGNLIDLVDAGVTQPIQSSALTEAIPAALRDKDNQWFGLSMRSRVLYAEKSLPLTGITYENLADPKWKGKVCIRAGQHPYNTALVAAMIAHHGEAKTETWLRGVKDNLARKATGGDRDVARDILGGICDVGLANSYYVGHMKNAKEGTDARKWGDAIKVVQPTFENGGTHVNISGAAVARHAPHKDQAVKLMEYLVSAPAQQIYAQANYEYPVRKGVTLDSTISSTIGEVTVDSIPLTDIVKFRKQASQLVDKVGFDQ